jgi:glycosyltransferase involved in cell wall biosynthesis
MVRIGLDLTALPTLKGGVAFYLIELVKALQRVDVENSYHLIARDVHADDLRPLTANFSMVPVSLRSRASRLVWEQVRLPALADRLRLDVLHSPHYTRPLRRLTCASVVGVMDLTFFVMPEYHTTVKRLFFRSMLRVSVRKADRFIAISKSTSVDLQKWLQAPASRIDVTPLAVSDAYSPHVSADVVRAVRDRYELPAEYLLYVGRLEPRKNLPRLIEAYERLLTRRPSTPPLVLAGAPGWHGHDLRRALRRLSAHVVPIGYVPEEFLPALYVGARLFVYPSLYEGFGIPVLEALSCGVPTITSNASSMAEVADGAAELIDPTSTDALLTALERLLTDAARCLELRELGLQRARSFSWDATARSTRDSYLTAARQFRESNAVRQSATRL